MQQCLLPFSPNNSTIEQQKLSSQAVNSSSSSSSSSSKVHRKHPRSMCERYIALDVLEHVDTREKVIRCFEPDSTRQPANNEDLGHLTHVYTVVLGGEWYNTPVTAGDIFHIVFLKPDDDKFDAVDLSQYTKVTDQEFLFIIHPDTLVTPSTLSESISCSRRGVLNNKYRTRGTSRDAVLGNIKHEFIEKYTDLSIEFIKLLDSFDSTSIDENILTAEKIEEIIDQVKSKHLESMLIVNLSDQEVHGILTSIVPKVTRWIFDFTADYLKACGSHKIRGMVKQVVYNKTDLHTGYNIDELSGIEENVWCPVLGVKGQVDLVVHARKAHEHSVENMPVEVKTGKWRPATAISHRAQTILYIIMILLRDKQRAKFPILQNLDAMSSGGNFQQTYHTGSKHGLLLYINDDGVRCEIVEPTWAEIRALIICRNRLASNLVHAAQVTAKPLPNMLKHSDCERCFSAAECFLSHASIEGGDKKSSGVPLLFTYVNRGLSSNHFKYFKKWNFLLDLENLAMTNFDDCLWTSSGDACERAMDKCICNLYISGHDTHPDHSILIFRKQHNFSTDNTPMAGVNHDIKVVADRAKVGNSPMFHLLEKGERVHISMETMNTTIRSRNDERVMDIEDIVTTTSMPVDAGWSIENIEPAMCVGNIALVTLEEVHVLVKKIPRRLLRHFGGLNPQQNGQSQSSTRFSFRIDKDSATVGVGTMRSNLIRLFVDPFNPNAYQERKMKVDKELVKDSSAYVSTSNSTITSTQSSKSSGSSHSKHTKSSGHMHQDPWADLSLPGAVKVRGLVVDLRKPLFKNDENIINQNFLTQQYHGCSASDLSRDLKYMNVQQEEAVRRIVCARDYVLLLGMPGTGKSSTLAFTIRALVAKGHRILVTSYTHSAVDSLLIKLKESGIDSSVLVRIGAKSSINESLHKYVLDSANLNSTELLRQKMDTARVVACTVLAASSDSIMKQIEFDYCIVDEAGQITQPAAIGALLLSKRFVLVGDDYQLPPLVLSSEAQSNGMDVSLFKRLAEAHPDTIVSLSQQYRMNAEIMQISNVLIYDQRLKCGSDTIARGRLLLPSISYASISSLSPWLQKCLDVDQPVMFINTDQLKNSNSVHNQTSRSTKTLESFQGALGSFRGSVVNLYEVEIIKRIHDALQSVGGYDMKNLGIVSPYRSQVTAIEDAIKLSHVEADNSMNTKCAGGGGGGGGSSSVCEISTVDKFQGRDMEVMVISMVRSNENQAVGNLLRDWRRVNVAMTRAKFKLIIVGSLSITDNIAVLKALGDLVKMKGYVIDVPEGDVVLPDPTWNLQPIIEVGT